MMDGSFNSVKELGMIFIIGGTGKVGQELLKQLAAKNVKAKVLVRSAEKAETVKMLGLEPVQGDFTNPSGFAAALSGVDTLFLLTTNHSAEKWAAEEIAVIDTAKQAGVKKVVLLSAVGSNPDSPLSLGQAHAKSEEHLKRSGLAYTILQPGGFMQNFLNQLPTIKQGAIYGNYKDGKMAFIDARDIAAVAVAALTEQGHEGKTYVITGGEAVSYPEVAAKLTALIGKPVHYVDVPAESVIQGMTKAGFPEWLAKDLSKMGEFVASGHAGSTTDVVEKIAKKKPFTVDQFLHDHAAAFKG
jgi:uncharacterized protein YbjT (DUF2867 family)